MTNRNALLLAVWLLTVSFSMAFAAGSGGSSGGAAGAGGRSSGGVASRGSAAVGLGVGGPGISTGLGGLQSTTPGFGTGIPGATIHATPSNPFGVIGGAPALGLPSPVGTPGTGV